MHIAHAQGAHIFELSRVCIMCTLTLSTIYGRFNVPPLFIVPPPREREHVPPESVPPCLLDWREGGNLRKYVQQSAAVRAPTPTPQLGLGGSGRLRGDVAVAVDPAMASAVAVEPMLSRAT